MNDKLENCLRIYSGVGMMESLGFKFVSMEEETAEIELVPDKRHANYLGALHGGAVAAGIDTVVFFPGCLLPSGRKLTTEGVELHFFRPSPLGEKVLFRARILRNGRRVVTVEAEAVANGKKIAHAIVTLLDMEA